jgi:hypothetical protein
MLASCFTSLPAVTKAVTVTKTPAVALFVHKLQMPLSDCPSTSTGNTHIITTLIRRP